MTVFKVENKDKRGSLKCKFILSALLNDIFYQPFADGAAKSFTFFA
jgi:hypothetical protein